MTGMVPVVGLHRLVRERGTVRATFPDFKPDHEGRIWACAGCSWKFSYDVDRLRATEVWHQDQRHKPPAPAVAPDSSSPVVVDPTEVSGPQNGTQPANRTVVQFPQPVDIVLPEVPLPDWEVALLMEREVDRLTEARERTADRLRMLAETAEAHGGRRRKAAARAYRLAADMIEEEQ